MLAADSIQPIDRQTMINRPIHSEAWKQAKVFSGGVLKRPWW